MLPPVFAGFGSAGIESKATQDARVGRFLEEQPDPTSWGTVGREKIVKHFAKPTGI